MVLGQATLLAPDLEAALRAIGAQSDAEIDLAYASLTLARLMRPDVHLDRYQNHFTKLAHDVAERHRALIAGGADDDVLTRLAALKHILADREGYQGDSETYNALENADITRVIDRRKGLPIALAILYIHAARAQGWPTMGINFPGHFIVRLEQDGKRILFDPFHGAKLLEAPDLRSYLKQALGPRAELSVTYYTEATNRDVLVRLQNNIKLRQIEAEDYEGALCTLAALKYIDPVELRFLFEEGVVNARIERYGAALSALNDYVTRTPDARDRAEAQGLIAYLQQLMQ